MLAFAMLVLAMQTLLLVVLTGGRLALATNSTLQLADKFATYEAAANATAAALQQAIQLQSTSSASSCSIWRACDNLSGLAFAEDARFDALPTNRSFGVFKLVDADAGAAAGVGDVGDSDEQASLLCAVEQLTPDLKANLEQPALEHLAFQHFARSSSNATFYATFYAAYPAYDWTHVGGCPDTFDATTQPWYTSAVSGAKNVVLLVDAGSSTNNSAQRFNNSRAVVREFLGALTVTDFATVIFYTNTVWAYNNLSLVRASSQNVEALQDFVDKFELQDEASTDIGQAVQTALLLTSASNSSTSGTSGTSGMGCTTTLVLLTSGENSVTDVNPVKTLLAGGVFDVVFSFIIAPNNTRPAVLVPTDLACTSNINGVVQVYSDNDIDARAPLQVFVTTMALAGTAVDAPVWTGFYEDVLTGRLVATVSRVVFSADGIEDGVLAIDVFAEAFGVDGAYAADAADADNAIEAVTAHIAATTTCAVQPNFTAATAQFGTACQALTQSEAQPELQHVQLFDVLLALTLLFVVAAIFVPPGVCALCEGSTKFVYVLRFLIPALVCGAIFVGTFYGVVFDDLVRRDSWVPVLIVVEAKEVNPYTCCEIQTLEYCLEADESAPLCSAKKDQCDSEGECNDGYYCCDRRCSSCSTGSMKSSCCTCWESVSNQKRWVARGTWHVLHADYDSKLCN